MFLLMDNENLKTVYIACDHAGLELKNYLIENLKSHVGTIHDVGPDTYNPDDDYPDYTKKVAEAVSIVRDHTVGIVICRNGVGVSIFANKFKGVRCALSWTPEHAKSARNDDDANVVALPADYITKEVALETVLAFLETPFSNEERHVRRLEKIASPATAGSQ